MKTLNLTDIFNNSFAGLAIWLRQRSLCGHQIESSTLVHRFLNHSITYDLMSTCLILRPDGPHFVDKYVQYSLLFRFDTAVPLSTSSSERYSLTTMIRVNRNKSRILGVAILNIHKRQPITTKSLRSAAVSRRGGISFLIARNLARN